MYSEHHVYDLIDATDSISTCIYTYTVHTDQHISIVYRCALLDF